MKTSELSGAALNWAVAMCEGWKYTTARDNTGQYPWLVKVGKDIDPKQYRPSSNWMQGGVIIEREGINLLRRVNHNDGLWSAYIYRFSDHLGVSEQHITKCEGTTPLIAAMRCYVASKLGAEVQIPEEVTNE